MPARDGSGPTVAALRAKHESLWTTEQPFDSQEHGQLALRTYRAISWFERAAKEHAANDLDVAFVLYWIAFNAAYASDVHDESVGHEQSAFRKYFGKLISLDKERAIHDAIWERFSGPVRVLMENKYLYDLFWHHANGKPGCAHWERKFSKEKESALRKLAEGRAGATLSILFRRLYTLRNQLVHGGATWNSSINRDSVRDGAAILAFLIPNFIAIMLDNPREDWGPPYYLPLLDD